MKQKGFAQIIILILLIIVLAVVGYFAYKNYKSTVTSSPTPSVTTTSIPISSASPSATLNWKTYENTNAQLSFKYPAQITEMLDTEGGVSGPVSGNANPIVSFADKTTVHSGTDAPFDGFSIYEIEVDKLGTSFDTYITNEVNAVKSSPVKVLIGSQNYTYIDSETNIRRYFILSPDNKRIIIFSRINSTTGFLNTFDQILSTFKFTQ
jgi:hypothetical protein